MADGPDALPHRPSTISHQTLVYLEFFIRTSSLAHPPFQVRPSEKNNQVRLICILVHLSFLYMRTPRAFGHLDADCFVRREVAGLSVLAVHTAQDRLFHP